MSLPWHTGCKELRHGPRSVPREHRGFAPRGSCHDDEVRTTVDVHPRPGLVFLSIECGSLDLSGDKPKGSEKDLVDALKTTLDLYNNNTL